MRKKQYLFLSLFFFILSSAYSQNGGLESLNSFIDLEQKKIDELDLKSDGRITVSLKEFNDLAESVYFGKLDTLQQKINAAQIEEAAKKNLLTALYFTTKEIDGRTYQLTSHYEKIFQNALIITEGVEKNTLLSALYTDPLYSIKNVYFYKSQPEAEIFLTEIGKQYPDEVFKVYQKFREKPYRDRVVLQTAFAAPSIVKKYLASKNEIRFIIESSTDPYAKAILDIFSKYRMTSNALCLLDEVANQRMTIDEAEVYGTDKKEYLKKLMDVRSYEDFKAIYSVDAELKTRCLEYVREINDLHDEKNPAIRFKCVEGFTAEELYILMVYSEEEIFTSTFNGLFERMLIQMNKQKLTGTDLLNSLLYNRFRSFIKLCAGFNALNDFLCTFSDEDVENLMQRFSSGLEKSKGDLTSAVDVADCFGSLRDTAVIKMVERNVISEYDRVSQENNKEGMAIYGLLASLFANKTSYDANWFSEISSKYKLEKIDQIAQRDLFGKDSIHRQLHFFYDDKDGEASFSSFVQTFNTPNWKISQTEHYVKIESTKGRKVEILANKPKSEYEGQALLIGKIDTFHLDVQMMVHRGHSYYAMNTVSHMPSTCRVVFLGSCGGYHNLSEVIEHSPNVHIISTKQIGTMMVNNPLLKIIAEDIRNNKSINWVSIWADLEKSVRASPYAYTKFQDYVPPHKNLGAIFIQAYKKMVL